MEPPLPTTVSACTSETARGKHVFNIAGYHLHKGMGAGESIRSATFAVGGYDWCVRYYPDGDISRDCRGYVSVYLELLTRDAEVRADYVFRLIDSTSALPSVVRRFTSKYTPVDPDEDPDGYGANKFIKQSELASYLRDDRLVIECEVKVINAKTKTEVQDVPPSDLPNHLGKLLDGKRGADVTFEVEGEVFSAHNSQDYARYAIAPVFDAQLYGPLSDAGATSKNIIVKDMEPPVFKALLHFIYTDSLPAMDDVDDGESEDMVKHLLVAADRYAMDRMKLMCEVILCKSLDVETAATTLALADQHHCSKLKDACVEYILSSNRLNAMVASKGYAHLKRSCPALMFDVFERATKSRKI
ncbi:BTB/POZ and MATH domain-containing protein 1-like [Triticum dicoccoides]|uniref:BTB/POZ and MATH domain-containing protein 1-like n=1 Tax=Triticum dicoccoides TaxID=85692 RepID=UPI00188FC641|nr:BTB/POZ and MATH domain-containing protein 1-like [Triticum dicoccoides]